ncbi:MAG: CocE/NonD family hydrolase [Actinomycetota bacterium]|nr:CocE/NonD family hydrolase [Actinomycetota bacterium]
MKKGHTALFRRISLCTAAALVSVGMVAGAQPASAGGGGAKIVVKKGRTQPVFSYKDAIRETVYIESLIDEDGTPGKDLIATDIIRPKETKTKGLKVSSIYEMSPYYQNIHGTPGPLQLGRGNEHEVKEEQDDDWVPEFFPLYYDNYFVPRGYAFIAQDMPGTRNSEGCMTLGGDGELAAAKATMQWLNGKGKAFSYEGGKHEVKAGWSNGKAGMVGKSYDGTIANAAISMGLPGLKTIVPNGGISRWYDYMFNHGVQYQGNTLTAPLFTYYIDQPPPDDDERLADWVAATFGQGTVCESLGTAVVAEAGNSEGSYTNFWHERDYLKDPKERPDCLSPAHEWDCIHPAVFPSKAKSVKTSVFIAHGINDWNVKPQNWFQWWMHLKRAGVPVKMWLSQTGHEDPFDFRREKFVTTLHRWMDKWLYGVSNGIMAEPAVDIQRTRGWDTYQTWPSRGRRMARLWLGPADGDRPGTLSFKRPGEGATQSYVDNQPEDDWQSYMVSDPKTAKDERLLFLTNKLNRDVRVSGQFKIWLSATVDRPDTNFAFYLVDYGKALRMNHNSDSGLRTTTKESCHGQSTAKDDACYFKLDPIMAESDIEVVTRGWLDARHRKNPKKMEPLTPGEKYMFRWTAMGEDYIFKKGHQIGVMVGGSDTTWTVPDPEQGANIEVHLHESKVKLPIVGRLGGIDF